MLPISHSVGCPRQKLDKGSERGPTGLLRIHSHAEEDPHLKHHACNSRARVRIEKPFSALFAVGSAS
jgi:hypothetical protein